MIFKKKTWFLSGLKARINGKHEKQVFYENRKS